MEKYVRWLCTKLQFVVCKTVAIIMMTGVPKGINCLQQSLTSSPPYVEFRYLQYPSLPSTPRDSHFLGCSTVMVSETNFLLQCIFFDTFFYSHFISNVTMYYVMFSEGTVIRVWGLLPITLIFRNVTCTMASDCHMYNTHFRYRHQSHFR
jgi:hypothetical protein